MNAALNENIALAVGVLILMNLGTIVTVLMTAGKAIWWASAISAKVDKNKESLDSLHGKIRDIEKYKADKV